MEIRVLKYFLAVAREGNITRAAEILHVTQPTLSRQLMQLEEELGASLFIRGKRKVVLTKEGLVLKRRAEEIIILANKTEMEIGKSSEISGEISLACGLTEATHVLVEYMEEFKKHYPQVSFSIKNGDSDYIVENISNGIIDLGLVLEPIDLEKFSYLRLKHQERWGLLIPDDSLLATKATIEVDDLSNLPLINTTRHSTEAMLYNWLKNPSVKLNYVASCQLTPFAAMLAKHHLGNAIVIEGSVKDINMDELCFKPFFPELMTSSLLIWKKYQSHSLAVTKFIDFIIKQN